MKVQNPDDALVLIAAFRYALGRRTYIVEYVVDFIVNNWDELETSDRKLIIKEILDAKDKGCIGQDCDWKSWQRVLGVEVALRNDEVPNDSIDTEW